MALRELKVADVDLINKLLTTGKYAELSSRERAIVRLSAGSKGPIPQKVRWAPLDGKKPGILIDGPGELFVPWAILKDEVEQKLLNQLGRVLPDGCRVELREFHGRKDWRVYIIAPGKSDAGRVWFGPDAEKKWEFDGMVRVGWVKDDYFAVVWQTFQRYSDGSYRLVSANW